MHYFRVAGNLPGFGGWINQPAMDDIHVAGFVNGLILSDGFHTLTTTTAISGQYYNAFVYGHGPAGTHTSYGYLAGYDRKTHFTVYYYYCTPHAFQHD